MSVSEVFLFSFLKLLRLLFIFPLICFSNHFPMASDLCRSQSQYPTSILAEIPDKRDVVLPFSSHEFKEIFTDFDLPFLILSKYAFRCRSQFPSFAQLAQFVLAVATLQIYSSRRRSLDFLSFRRYVNIRKQL